jgi:hypothetical protein
MGRFPLLARSIGLLLITAVICNGASVFLKRTGLADSGAYAAYWAVYCAAIGATAEDRKERPCAQYTTAQEIERAVPKLSQPLATTYEYVYGMSAGERWLKLAKDLFWFAFLGICAAAIATRAAALPRPREAWPIYLLAAYVLGSFAMSLLVNGALVAAAGLRAFTFVMAGVLALWIAPYVGVIARSIAALLVLEAALLPFELVRGIHIFHDWSPWSLASRVAGTLAQPNSLGVFSAVAVAFYCSFAAPRAHRAWLLGAIALVVVLLSGSATGLVCAALGLWLASRQRLSVDRRWLAPLVGAALAAIVLLSLPALSGREDVFDSIWSSGRVARLQAALQDRPFSQVALGSGLGVNTNSVLNLTAFAPSVQPVGPRAAGLPADAALTSFVVQIGVVGTMLFYLVLAWAARRDPVARPFYYVLAVCTLTINVGELFPVNALLGIAWAHSASRQGHSGASEPTHHD